MEPSEDRTRRDAPIGADPHDHAGVGALPAAVGTGAPRAGEEIEGPMAMVILGDLFSSTELAPLVLPSLALRFAHFIPAHLGSLIEEALKAMSAEPIVV